MTSKKMLFWKNGNKATPPAGWEVCFNVPGADRTLIYGQRGGVPDSSVDFGFDDFDGDNNRDRNTQYGLILSGLMWMNSTAREIKIDLPDGPGTYNVYATCCDSSGFARSVNFDFHDGVNGTILHSWTGTSTSTTLVNIDGSLTDMAACDDTTAPGVQLAFTTSQLSVEKAVSGQSYFNAIWLESAGSGPPPTDPFYNPFSSRVFDPANYERRIG